MATTLDEVRNAILPEEPNYERAAARLGEDALPFLAALAVDEDTMIAMKAVSLAGLIGGRRAARIAQEAAESDRPELRVVAAGAAARLGAAGEPVIESLLADTDRGVRKHAIRAVKPSSSAELKGQLDQLLEAETDLPLRDLLATKLRGLR
jgi:HEAT repeat protein